MSQQVDEKIIKKIHYLVGEGIRSIDEMERYIRHYVREELFRDRQPPSIESRRYFPLEEDIRNHMYSATSKLRLSKIDQENLHLKIMGWKKDSPEDSFYFRSYGKVKEETAKIEQLFYNEHGDRITIDEVKIQFLA